MDAQEWMRRFEYAVCVLPRAQGLRYAALCFECNPLEHDTGPMPMLAVSAVVRDAWGVQHAGISGHTVDRYNLRDEGTPHCPAQIKPPAARPRRPSPTKESHQ